MNSSTYIFGELSNGYSQYPEDSSSNLFREIQGQCEASSQLIIHRDENLMYYIYVRKFNKNKYIGFAIVINGYYFTQVKSLFSLFEKEIEDLVEAGIIINFSDNGEVVSNLLSLKKEEEEVLLEINSLQKKINNIKGLKKLPPIDYSVAISSRKLFKATDAASDIANASIRFGFTIVLKESDYDTVRTTSVKNVLRNLCADKNALIKENGELKEQNKKILRQKKQFKNVVFLVLLVLVCGVGIYFLYENLDNTQDRLETANNTISVKESIIFNKNSTISNLIDSVDSLENILSREIKAKEKLESSLQSICSYSPFVVTNCNVNETQFKFNYFCPEEKSVTVTLKAISESGYEIITGTYTIKLSEGAGSKKLEFIRRLDYSESYYVVLIYNGRIVAGKRWD